MIGPRLFYITGRDATVGENCQNKTIDNQLIGPSTLTQSDLTAKYCKPGLHFDTERGLGGGGRVTTNQLVLAH